MPDLLVSGLVLILLSGGYACGAVLLIPDDFLLHTITDERDVKVLFEILEKHSEINMSTTICSQ